MKTCYYTDSIIEICTDRHLSVEEIFKEICKKFPDAWKSSIYRNVEELVNKWELKKVIWVWKKCFFEKAKEDHIHLIDEKTNKIVDLELKNLSIPNLPNGFNISKVDLKIFWNFES